MKTLAPSEHGDKHMNRKFYHFMSVQLVVGSGCTIRNLVVKCASRLHDAWVLLRSGLARKFENGFCEGLRLPVKTVAGYNVSGTRRAARDSLQCRSRQQKSMYGEVVLLI